jgi:protein-disulfide isomerase
VKSAAAAAPAPSSRALGVLALIAGLNAAWSSFLWRELVRSQSGLTPFCALGDPANCAAVWNAPFARAVGRLTGVPVAGWGLAWSLAALALPILLMGRPRPALLTAVRLTAAAGLLSVFVLLGVSAAERTFCSSCAITYVLVGAYAGIALFGWSRLGLPRPGAGAAWTAAATGAAYLLLLAVGPRPQVSAAPPLPASSAPAAAGDPERALADYVGSLPPPARQGLADSLALYRAGPAVQLPPPHSLRGPADAPVRVTEWTDVLCGHCADLHAFWEAALPQLPSGSVAIESRHFPLDAECNPLMKSRQDPVRCLAARVQICQERDPMFFSLQGSLFANQRGLSPEKVLSLAGPSPPRAQLLACAQSEATSARLQEDIGLAARYQPEGTPLVVVNGRKAVSYPPFLYSIVLARGDGSHPAFASLPPPNANAHMH